MTSRQLTRLCRYWQRKLGLRDWQISITFATADEMHETDNVGECLAQLCDRTAHITILRDGASDYEMERRLLHECHHIVFPPEITPRDPVKAKLFESAIDQMATTLMFLKRGAP